MLNESSQPFLVSPYSAPPLFSRRCSAPPQIYSIGVDARLHTPFMLIQWPIELTVNPEERGEGIRLAKCDKAHDSHTITRDLGGRSGLFHIVAQVYFKAWWCTRRLDIHRLRSLRLQTITSVVNSLSNMWIVETRMSAPGLDLSQVKYERSPL